MGIPPQDKPTIHFGEMVFQLPDGFTLSAVPEDEPERWQAAMRIIRNCKRLVDDPTPLPAILDAGDE